MNFIRENWHERNKNICARFPNIPERAPKMFVDYFCLCDNDIILFLSNDEFIKEWVPLNRSQ